MRQGTPDGPSTPTLGIAANLPQFVLLVGVNGLVGALVGQERTLVPLLGERMFNLGTATAVLLFIVTFGFAKAAGNLAAGFFADRLGRRMSSSSAGWSALRCRSC
jgi:hypothetical protein